jgi:hypothetical protein
MAMQAEHTQPHTQLSGTESDRRAPVRRCGGAGGALTTQRPLRHGHAFACAIEHPSHLGTGWGEKWGDMHFDCLQHLDHSALGRKCAV